ncbi:hypothetical protein AVEN_157511-1 [Araneus ventricosus]|uniref:Uncharacterized protein n=1 Tax=Araneus ventricosus TaxID=182803 RepID=A0A4Y2WBF1_ARAVE|nr:hypothetical protein AVEN_157511-1 [Araneus ventricosus]
MIHRVSKHCVLRGIRPTETGIYDKIHTFPKFKSPPIGSLDGRPVAALYKMADLDDVPLLLWPPRSLDLTPFDFFLWGYVKDKIYVPQMPKTLQVLQEHITAVGRTFTETYYRTSGRNWITVGMCAG